MGLISEVKCGRCDRRYSGLRARCPYCGARRGKRGKHAKDYDNSKGRFVIGLILVLVLVVAVIVVIATSTINNPADNADDESQQTQQGGNVGTSDDITNVEGTGAGTTAGNEDGEADSVVPDDDAVTGEDTTGEDVSGVAAAVNDLYIVSSWSDEPQGDFTASVGDVIEFDFVTDPELEDPDVLWETSDDSVFVILQTGEFTAVGEGSATLKLTVNGVSEELYVYVN